MRNIFLAVALLGCMALLGASLLVALSFESVNLAISGAREGGTASADDPDHGFGVDSAFSARVGDSDGSVSRASGGPALGLHLALDYPVLLANTSQRAVMKLTIDPQGATSLVKRLPINLAVVLDRSGSMSGEKMTFAKAATIEAIRRLTGDDTFSLVTYNDRAEVMVPAQKVNSFDRLAEIVDGIQTGGSTGLFSGVSKGAAEISKNFARSQVNRILLLSDGLANVGPRSPEDLAGLGSELARQGITVSTVGLGSDYNEDLMSGLAQQGEGSLYFVQSSADLERVFNIELGDIGNVAARDVKIDMEFPEGVQPLALLGWPGEIHGNCVHTRIRRVYGHMPRHILVEVVIAPQAREERFSLARASVEYLDASTGATHQLENTLLVAFSDSQTEVDRMANVEVHRDVVAVRVAAAKDEAVALMDEGETEAAAGRMRLLGEEVGRLYQTLNDEFLGRQTAVLREEAKELEEEGMSNRKRKSYRADSYHTRNQQYAF